MDINGTFTLGERTIPVSVSYDGDDRTAILVEFTLHVPEGVEATFASDQPRVEGRIVVDRDPGHFCLETDVIPRRTAFPYAVSVSVDGHTRSEHGVTGGETNIAWKEVAPTPPAAQPPITGAHTEIALEGGVGVSGDVRA